MEIIIGNAIERSSEFMGIVPILSLAISVRLPLEFSSAGLFPLSGSFIPSASLSRRPFDAADIPLIARRIVSSIKYKLTK
jgi:hypothetical protein